MNYRHLSTTKFLPGGKRKSYRLGYFNQECSTRGVRGNICTLTNLRCLKDGSGLATVKSETGVIKGRQGGTWRLHFASCSILKRHLEKRVIAKRPETLHGSKKRRRRKGLKGSSLGPTCVKRNRSTSRCLEWSDSWKR